MSHDTHTSTPVVTDGTAVSFLKEAAIHYRDRMLAFEEREHSYTLKIENLKVQIEKQKMEKEPEEQKLLMIERDLFHEEKTLETLNKKFKEQMHSLKELQVEYRPIIDPSEYHKLLQIKKENMKILLDEIDELELKVLNTELERLNCLEVLTPKRTALDALREALRMLELEKNHLDSSLLPQAASLPQPEENKEDEIIVEAHPIQ